MEYDKKFLICAIGIFGCFFIFGILQEKVTKAQYITEDGTVEAFTFATGLVFCQCLVNLIVAKVLVSTIWPVKEDSTRTSYYAICALTYVLAMICTTMSLQYVSFPTQVVAKASKPIPVMLFGVMLGRRSYALKKYGFVFLIVFGVALFMYKDKKGSAISSDEGYGFGEVFLLLSLVMDGLIAAIQERMRAEHQTKSMPMMLNINAYASLLLFILVVLSGEAFYFLSFIQRHPELLWKILLFALAGACGQIFIFYGVSEYGPLPVSIVTTVRKFFTVLVSVIFLGNTLLARQWLATLVVFAGLFLDALYGKSPPKATK